MLNAVLLSIHPEYVQRILTGQKHYEFRRINFKQPITHVVMYETAPKKLITGYFKVKAVHRGHPIDVWKDCGAQGEIEEIPYFGYYKRCQKAIAIEVGEVTKLERPIALAELGINSAPQTFIYLKNPERVITCNQ